LVHHRLEIAEEFRSVRHMQLAPAEEVLAQTRQSQIIMAPPLTVERMQQRQQETVVSAGISDGSTQMAMVVRVQ
jgi:hypothetical protein